MSTRSISTNVRTVPGAGRSLNNQLWEVAKQIPAYALLVVLSFAALMPFVWLLLSAFKPYKEIINPVPSLFPQEWTLGNFSEILSRVGFAQAFFNTAWVAFSVTLIQALTSSATGFVFAKYKFPGKDALFTLLLTTMMVPFAVLLVPLFVQVVRFGLIDNLSALVVVSLWNTFSVFAMRQFMESIPNELLEAARIDGAGEFWIYRRIAVPLALMPLSAMSVFTFLGQWDNFLFPSVVINDPAKQTLPLLLAGLRSIYWTRYDMWITGALLTVLPVLIAYGLAQRTFVRGVQMTGMKG